MAEKEKVMTITLMRSDLYDAPAYTGAYITLPADSGEIQDALDRARITNHQPFQVVEYFNMQGETLDFIPDKPSLAELNFLASRISDLDEYGRMAFTGCALMGDGHPTMQALINITYNLEDVHCIQAKNDQELGKFYLDNDFVDAVNHIPSEYQQEVIELLDLEKIGRIQREADGGVYVNGLYVVDDFGNQKQVYDGVHLPMRSFSESYVFELMVCDGTFYPSDIDECTMLKLPATPDEMAEVLKEQEIKSFEGCVVYTNKSSIPRLNGVFSEYEDIEKIKLLADQIYGLRCQGQEAKFKAALELMDCTDIDLALDITQNMDCFDFHPELSSPEEYAKQEFINKYQIPSDDPVAQLIQFGLYSPALMKQDNAQVTPYGVIRTNDKHMVLEYSSPQSGQQML